MVAVGLKGRVCCPVQRESSKHLVSEISYPANTLCPSGLLSHLARFKERLPTPPSHHAPEENYMRGITSAIANSAMLMVCLLCQPCYTLAQLFIAQQTTSPSSSCHVYDPVKYNFDSSSTLPLLSALELLQDCNKLSSMPEIWRLQLNDDIHKLQSEFGERIPIQLQFICCHWIALLCAADCVDDEIMAALSRCIQVLRPWVVAMGIMGKMRQACEGLRDLYLWLVCINPAMQTPASHTRILRTRSRLPIYRDFTTCTAGSSAQRIPS